MSLIAAPESILNFNDVEEIAFLLNTFGSLSLFNQSFQDFLGYSPAALSNKTLADFTVNSERHLATKFTQRALAGIPAYGHLAFLTRKGEKKIGKVTLVPFFADGAIAGATCFIQDVTETVHINKEIYDQEQRLKAIFYHEPDCVAVLAQEGTIIDLNPAGYTLLEGSREVLAGSNFFQMVRGEDRDRFADLHQQVFAGSGETLQFCLTSLKGNVRWVEANTVPLKDKYGKIYASLSVIRDISEKKGIEEQLQKQQQRIENTRRIARIGYWEYDFARRKGHATDALYEIYGLHREQFPEITFELFLSLVHPEDRSRMKAYIQNLLQVPRMEEELRLLRPDGQVVHVHYSGSIIYDEDGKPLFFSGAIQDITERKESEARLLLSEQKFKSLVQNSSDIIVIMNEGGNFKYISPTAKSITGYDPEDLLSKNAFDLIHPDDYPMVKKELAIVLKSNGGMTMQHRFLNAAGEWIWLETKAVNLMHDTIIQGIVVNARNITDRMKLQEQLDKELASRQKDITSAVIKAQEGERSQLGQELHDNVNQVLTTVKLYNEMLLDKIGNPEEILHKSVHHLQQCINEIRSISKRLSAPTLGKISLSDSICELVESINLTKKINIRCSIKDTNPSAVTQEVHLTVYRIIQEQLNNILKHAEASDAHIELVNTPKEFRLTVKDNGKGFDVNKKRTGIGITNIITRAENIGGRISIESKPGSGCNLKLQLPPLS